MSHDDGKNPSEKGFAAIAVNNPHLIIVAALFVLILGSLAMLILPKDLLPSANLPAVQILSFYSGMPVEHVEKNLTARFERYTGQAIGMERQESKSLVGVSIVKNFFSAETDLNTAIAQTTSLVMSVLRRLPPGTQPPLILPFDPMAAVPLALVAVSGDYTEKELYDTARYDVRNTIQSVNGAMAPTVMGGSERQVVVFIDPKKLKQYNFSSLDVMEKLSNLNTFIPTGNIKIDNYDYQILSNGIVDKITDMDEFPLRSDNGTPVYLKEIGQAKDASKVQTNIVMVDGKRQVYVPVYRQPGANSIRVVDEVRTSLAKLEKNLKGFKLSLVADQSSFIRHAISSITEEAVIGGGLAAVMVLLFLGNPTATFGILLSLPLSILCAFLGLKASGQTINAMTLGGLALSIGVLVDNSIVVLENITKKLHAGHSARDAALLGTSEVAMPVLASTIATLIVFFPVVFLTGVVKTLFSALAKAVIFAMIGSFLTAMTVMPLFASRFLKPHSAQKKLPSLLQAMQHFMHHLTKAYGHALALAIRHRKLVLSGTLILLTAGAMLLPFIGTELFPRADAGNFVLELRQTSGTRIESTEIFARQVEAKLREWIGPEDLHMIITNAGVYYGFPAAFTPNSGPQDVFFNVELTEHRKHTSQYYAKILRARIPQAFPKTEMGIELGGLLTSALNGGLRSPIDVQFEGPSMEKSHELAITLAEQIKKLRGAVDVRVQQRLDAPQINLDVNRKKAMELGLTTEEVVKNVVSAVSGSATFNPSIWVDPKSGIDYLLGVQFHEDAVSSLDQLSNIPITGKHQERGVPLSRLANIGKSMGASEINHVNLKPVIDIFLDAQDRDIGGLSGDVLSLIKKTQMPTGYSASIRGEISEMNNSVGTLGGGFLLAAVLVYLILVVQFRSFSLPLIIMATVPMGMVGIIVMLAATKTYFSIQAAIGAIFMIGIAVANGVLLIEFITHMASEEPDQEKAVVNGAMARLRPILMTSLASMLGLVPMAIGLGHGSEANIPLGRAVIGGQLVSTVLTLFVVPILYGMITRKKSKSAIPEKMTTVSVGATLVLILLFSLPAQTAKADAGEISATEVMQLVEKKSPELAAARSRETAAESTIGIARSGYFPTLDFEAIDSTGFAGSSGLTGVSGLMGSPYRSGLGLGVVAKETLWDFGRTSNNVSAAKYDAQARKEDSKVTLYQIKQDGLRAFYDCSRFRSQRDVWLSISQDSDLIATEVKRYVTTGQRSVVEKFLVESQTEEAKTAAADFDERLKASVRLLGTITGLQETAIHCPTTNSENAQLPAFKTDGYSSPLLARARADSDAAQARVDQAKSGHLPKLVAVASVGHDEKARLVQKQDYAIAGALIFPLFDGLHTTNEVSRAEATAMEKDKELEVAQEKIDGANARYDEVINSAKVRITHLDDELKLANEAFALAKKRYLAFQGTLIDVRESLRNLARAQTQINDARAEFLQASGAKALVNGAQF